MTTDPEAELMRATPGTLEHPEHGVRIIAARTVDSDPDEPVRSEEDVTAGTRLATPPRPWRVR